MKLRYYMRGLGIGILVTTILMTVTLNGKTEKLSDAEIIERAEALGMEQKYETTVLADTVSENETEDETENEAELEEEKPQEIEPQEIITDVPETSEEDSEEEMTEEEPSVEDISAEEETEDAPDAETEVAETVQITVVGGDGSQTVARKLAEAGLVEDAVGYDKYLCANGYDKRICTGTHSIPVGASEQEIAEIITSRP